MPWPRLARRLLAGALFLSCALLLPRRAGAVESPQFFLYMLTNHPSSGQNGVAGFAVDSSGAQSVIDGSPFVTSGTGMASVAGSEYAHRIVVSRPRDLLFAANEAEGTIAVFKINGQTGALTRVPGSPFAVSGFASNNAGMSLAVSSDGKLLYGSNPNVAVGSTSVVSMSVAANGALSPVGATFSFGTRVNGMAVSDANDHLYLAMSDFRVAVLKTGANGLTFSTQPSLSVGSATDVAMNHLGDTLYVGSNAGITAFQVSAPDSSGNLSFTPRASTPFFALGPNLSGLSLDFFERVLVAYGSKGPTLASGLVTPGGALSPVTPLFAPSSAALSPDGRRLFTSSDGGLGVTQIDAYTIADTGELVRDPLYPIALPFASGFSKLVTFPSKPPLPAPALPFGFTLALILGLLSVVPSRKPQCKSFCSQSSDN